MRPANHAQLPPLAMLPDELILEVISHIKVSRGFLPDADQEKRRRESNAIIVRTLHALTLACRRLNNLATSELYQSIIQPEHAFRTTRQLLQTLLERRDLAKRIQYFESQLTITWVSEIYSYAEIEDVDTWRRIYPDTDLSFLMQYLPGCKWVDHLQGFNFDHRLYHEWNPDERRLWSAFPSNWHSGRGEFGGAMLIALAENLVEVALMKSRYMLDILELKGYNQPKGLHRVCLTNLWIVPLDTTTITVVAATPDVSIAAYLRVATITGYSDSYDPSKLKIKDLIVDNCNLYRDYLLGLLTPCSSLQNFSCRWVSHEHPQKIDLPHLYQGLAEYKSCLESLTLDTLESSWLVGMDEDVPPLGSLRDFTALKHLDVSGLCLWGDIISIDFPRLSSILPVSLEILIIKTEWDEDVEQAFFDLCEDCTALLPALKSVDCSWRPAPRHIADYFTRAFKEVGVKITLVPTDEEV